MNLNSSPETQTLASAQTKRRSNLLPWWVITFTLVFLIFLIAIPIAIVLGILGYNFQLSLLGLTTTTPFSVLGLLIIALFAFKGITAFGLWTEKVWAVKLAQYDAIISIIIASGVFVYTLFFSPSHSFSFRLEILVAIPYLNKMRQIQYEWENFGNLNTTDSSEKGATLTV